MRFTQYFSLLLAVSISLPVIVPQLGQSAVQLCALLVLLVFMLEILTTRSILLRVRMRASTSFRLIFSGVFLLAIAAFASAVAASDSLAAFEVGVRYLIGLALLIALIASHQDLRSLRRLATALVVGACVASILAIIGYQNPQIGAFSIGVSRRAKVFFEHPNQLGMVLSAIFAIPVAALMLNPRVILGWLAAALIGTGVVLSGSMANTLLLVAGAFLVFIVILRRAGMIRILASISAGVFLLSALAVFGTQAIGSLSPRLGAIVESVTYGDGDLATALPSVSERLGLYSDAWQLFQSNPLFGIGGDNAYQYLQTPSGRPIPHAHNFFLDVLMSMGLLGAVAALVFGLGWIAIALQLLRPHGPSLRYLQAGVGSALLVFMVSNQSSDSLGGTIVYLAWALLSLALGLLQQSTLSARFTPTR